MGGHVAGAARIGIVAPGAADLTVLLDNEEILHPRSFETGRHGDPAEAAADDQNLASAARPGGAAAGVGSGGTRSSMRKFRIRASLELLRSKLDRRSPPDP